MAKKKQQEPVVIDDDDQAPFEDEDDVPLQPAPQRLPYEQDSETSASCMKFHGFCH